MTTGCSHGRRRRRRRGRVDSPRSATASPGSTRLLRLPPPTARPRETALSGPSARWPPGRGPPRRAPARAALDELTEHDLHAVGGMTRPHRAGPRRPKSSKLCTNPSSYAWTSRRQWFQCPGSLPAGQCATVTGRSRQTTLRTTSDPSRRFDSLDHPGDRVVRVEHQRRDPRRRGQASGEQLGGAGVRSEVVDRFRSSAGAVDRCGIGRLGQQVGHHRADLLGVPASALVDAGAM